MSLDLHVIEVVHPGAAERSVGGGKAGRLDDVRFDTEAGGEAKDGPGVLGNVGLEQGDAHGLTASSTSGAAGRFDAPFPGAVAAARRARPLPRKCMRRNALCDFWSLRHACAVTPLALPWQGCQ